MNQKFALNVTLIITVLGAALSVYQNGRQDHSNKPPVSQNAQQSADILQDAFHKRIGDLQIQGSATVVKILSDDLKGAKHQRFLAKTENSQILFIAHNIDLAPRIPSVKVGETIEFFGEYEWNEKGGVIHWTHKDPSNRHVDGWLKYQGKIYQ